MSSCREKGNVLKHLLSAVVHFLLFIVHPNSHLSTLFVGWNIQTPLKSAIPSTLLYDPYCPKRCFLRHYGRISSLHRDQQKHQKGMLYLYLPYERDMLGLWELNFCHSQKAATEIKCFSEPSRNSHKKHKPLLLQWVPVLLKKHSSLSWRLITPVPSILLLSCHHLAVFFPTPASPLAPVVINLLFEGLA